MGWQIHPLGNFSSAQNIANAAIPVLQSLGYTASYANSTGTQGTLSVTVDGKTYACGLTSAHSSTNYQTYLLANNETKEIVIYQAGANPYASQALSKLVNLYLFRGTDVKTGEAGLFTQSALSGYVYSVSNPWNVNDTSMEHIIMQRAVFLYGTHGSPFIAENVFWGTAGYAPLATCKVGNDTFVCLNGFLYAKL